MDAEIIELSNLDDLGVGEYSSANFGSGIELLMNDKKREGTRNFKSSDIGIDDLNELEKELNSFENPHHVNKSDFFSNDDTHSVKFVDEIKSNTEDIKSSHEKTWDGFSKFNNIPINPEREMSSEPKLTRDEMLREKFKLLRKLETLEKKGVELTRKYNMESSLAEMQGEYETIIDEKEKENSIKFQGNMMMSIINGIEYLNGRIDPFDIKLDGWSDQLNDNLSDYDSIFAELHEKYKTKASLAPELKLLFQLGGSAMMVHMSNTIFKTAMPGMDDIFRQNPDLMRSFQSATVNAMGQTNPGLSGFMNNVMNNNGSSRGPPPPMATQGPNAVPPPSYRSGNNNASRNMGESNFRDDGINVQEKNSSRPEMKGPSHIADILSGIKTKTVEIKKTNDSSTVSISDLKGMQHEGNFSTKSRRRQKSEKAISLDL